MMGFKAFHSAQATIAGIETAHMIRKGQLSEEYIPAYKQFMAFSRIVMPEDKALFAFTNACDRTLATPCADSVCWPYGIQALEDIVVVADSGNNRVSLWKLAV